MASSTLPPYQYTPIPPGTRTFRAIRLLDRLLAWPAFLSRGTLRLQIEEVHLDSPCAYECLSYTWGDTKGKQPDRPVVIETANGPRQLFIYRPLEIALLQMMGNGNISGLLFVDQICLDQSNDVEKADQVPLMQHIYAKSTRTLVWLGPGTRLSDRWFDFVHDINTEGVLSRLMGPNRGHFMQVFDAVMDKTIQTTGEVRDDVDDLRKLLDQYARFFPLKAIEDVFKRSWFSRLWIIQEVCLPGEVTFICGTRSLCLDCFRSGNLFFSVYSSYLPTKTDWTLSKSQVTLHWQVLQLVQVFIRIYQERRAIHVAGARQSSMDTVMRYNVVDTAPKVEAARDEDRIYGLMGLMASEDDLHGIEVRYNDVVGLYTEFAAIQLQKNLDTLCYAQFPKGNDVPSWVPDWSMPLRTPQGYTDLKKPQFSAGIAPNHAAQVEIDLGSRTLCVNGVVVDRITRVGEREFSQNMSVGVTEQVDNVSAHLFLCEVDEFLGLVSKMPGSGFIQYNSDAERRDDADIRLADHGLSERYLRGSMSEAEIRSGLRAARLQVTKLGEMLVRAEEKVRSYRIDRIFNTVGILPWYWVPAGESDICHSMAIEPLATSLNWAKGAVMFLADVVVLCLSSSLVVGASHWVRLRSQWQRQAPLSSEQQGHLRKHGLTATLDHSKSMSTFKDYMLKNLEQRLYVTEHGFIGLGPRTIQPDDVVVVLPGSTVPHALRRKGNNDDEGGELWFYLGEVYCDGIMDGEMLRDGEAAEVRTFRIR